MSLIPRREDWPDEKSYRFIAEICEAIRKLTPDASFYTPTFTGITNVTAITADVALWCRIGSIGIVAGRVVIDPTAATTLTEVDVSLPFTSNLGLTTDVSGVVGQADTQSSGNVQANTTDKRARLRFTPADGTNRPYRFIFLFRIIQ